jgi:hypothetical protein
LLINLDCNLVFFSGLEQRINARNFDIAVIYFPVKKNRQITGPWTYKQKRTGKMGVFQSSFFAWEMSSYSVYSWTLQEIVQICAQGLLPRPRYLCCLSNGIHRAGAPRGGGGDLRICIPYSFTQGPETIQCTATYERNRNI